MLLNNTTLSKAMKFYKQALLSIASVTCFATAPAQLVINEIMQSNIDCIMDDINEFPDSWVELYNPGTETVSLKDYKLGDKNKVSKAYDLPSIDVKPGDFIVIYCDKEGQGLHASFRLESGKGCNLYLFKGEEIVDNIEDLKKQPAPNIAYGRKTDGDDKWGYQAIPTPGKPNCGELCKEILGEPVFSTKGKVFSDSFELSLALPSEAPEGTVIRYTTDGKEPTEESSKFSDPIKISNSKVVRAKLFCAGYLSPRSTTHSFIKHPRKVTLPVVSIVTNRDYFYDNKLGIYVEGNYKNGTPNYKYDWRRPINYEYFEAPDTESVINQLCETRVKGGATRGNALKSLAVYANKRFGEKRFNYEFFPDQTPGISEFKSFEMRNSGNDFDYMYMRDAIIQQSMGMNADLDWQPSRPVIFYINGEYKGILNVRPRSNEDYVYSYYEGLEDIDIIENWYELKEGSMDNFNDFTAFYKETGHTHEEFQQWMDTEEFCNLMIMAIFFDNEDFPGNNIVMWRPIADGGKWRWIAKDTDFGLGLYGASSTYKTLNWITTPGYDNNRNNWANTADASRLFRRLLDTPEWKDMFIDRSAIYMGDFLTANAINERIDKRYNELKFEYKFHREQFNPWWPNYDTEISNAKKWTRQRCTFFYKHLGDFFKLKSPVDLTIEKGSDKGRTLIVNDVTLKGKEFNGKFFPGRQLTVKSVSDTDSLFVNGWEVKITKNGNTTTDTYNTEILSLEMPEGSKVEISSILGTSPLSVDEITGDFNPALPCQVYDLSGRFLGVSSSASNLSISHGVYILRQGNVSRKAIVK